MRSHLAVVVVFTLGGMACSKSLQPTVRPCPVPVAHRAAGSVGIIGMSFDRHTGTNGAVELVVDRIVPDGPAATAGIRPGDRILRIEGVSTEHMSIADAARSLRGPIDASVTLVIATGDRPRDVTITRVAPSELWHATGHPTGTGKASVPPTDLAPAAKVAVPPCRP